MTLGISPKRRKSRWLVLAAIVSLLTLVVSSSVQAGTVGTRASFEDDDGNLAPNGGTPNFDWNSFATTTWTGTAPNRQSTKTVSGWKFLGIEDAQATTSDNGFAGGTKQDDNCPTVITAKAPNKDDLKRIYLATKTVPVTVGGVTSDHIFLMLAWVRIPQNTTSASAHVGFEFNKATGGACPTTSDGLVNRVAGDMLIVYDFEGSSTDSPVLTLRRWVTSGSCEISNDTAPCWGPATTLSAGVAEAKVNTSDVGTVTDTISPTSPSSESLGNNEFGEAGIDLTAANVFSANTCESFGKAYAVSRSSGNSGQAQMKDLVGPAPFTLQNCGEVKIIKRTNPRGLNQAFPFNSDIAGSQLAAGTAGPCRESGAGYAGSYTLNDSGNSTSDSTANTNDCVNVPPGTYTVAEGTVPSGFAFNNFSCTSSGGNSTTPTSSTTGKSVSITVVGSGLTTCVYTNDQQLGAIKVTKTAKNANCAGATPPDGCDASNNAPLAGAGFEIWLESNSTTGLQTTASGSTPADTQVKNEQLTALSGTGASTAATTCFTGLGFNTYYVHESTVPTGYAGGADQTAIVSTNANCSGTGTPVAKSFSNTPLSQIRVTFHSLAGSGVTTATIQCTGTPDLPGGDDSSASNLPDNTTGRLLDNLPPGTYDCQVMVDP